MTKQTSELNLSIRPKQRTMMSFLSLKSWRLRSISFWR